MFKSKKELDIHARDIMSKIINESEKRVRAFALSRAYYQIREFESARRYLEAYLSSKPANSSDAYKLMGDIMKELGDKEMSLENYKTSFNQQPSPELLIRICDLSRNKIGTNKNLDNRKKLFELKKSAEINNSRLWSTNEKIYSPTTKLSSPANSLGQRNIGPPSLNTTPKTLNTNKVKIYNNHQQNGRTIDGGGGGDYREDLLERLLDQNSLILEKVTGLEEEIRLLKLNSSGFNSSFTLPSYSIKEKTEVSEIKELSPPKYTSSPAKIELSNNRLLSELIKKSDQHEGSWQCKSCYVVNTKNSSHCLSCNEWNPLKPKDEQKDIEKLENLHTNLASLFAPSAFSFKLSENQNQTLETFNFNFGGQIGQGFGDIAKSASTATSELSAFSGFAGFGNFNATVFPSFNSTSAINSNFNPNSNQLNNSKDDDTVEEYEPTVDFQPVVPLPPLVEVVRGDENENILFDKRALLFRFDSSATKWKERGVGNIKILQNKENSSKVRIVMWREQVHKLACNHYIKIEMQPDHYKQNLKTVTWNALDYAEEESKVEIFNAKFSDEKKGKLFKEKLNEVIEKLKMDPKYNLNIDSSTDSKDEEKIENKNEIDNRPLSELFKKADGSWECKSCYVVNDKNSSNCLSTTPPDSTTSEKSEEDFSIIFEKSLPNDLIEKALKLQLPKNFFAFEILDFQSCKGCRGCNSDEFDVSTINN